MERDSQSSDRFRGSSNTVITDEFCSFSYKVFAVGSFLFLSRRPPSQQAEERSKEMFPPLRRFQAETWAGAGPGGTYVCGLVFWKISSMQQQVTFHTSGLNFSPFRITRFSRQLVPDRASCSLSVEETNTSR